MTKEAVRYYYGLEAVREGVTCVIGTRGELLIHLHTHAPIWSENEVPVSIVETAYDYCEELTRRKLVTSSSFKLQITEGYLAMLLQESR